VKRIVFSAFSTLAALVLLFSYPTSTGTSGSSAAETVSEARVVTGVPSTTPPSSAANPTTGSTPTGQGPDPAASDPSATTTSPDGSTTQAAPSQGASVTVDGAEAMTRYGVVQVEVVITNGVITEVTALQYPQSDRKDVQINSRAIPQLRAQVLSAQSAKIDGVSGATFTTDGYVTSLQSALDAAGFGQ
jgi:uncharacterized protein with FMN-binding domain